ncbi:hypothetical protein B0H17DRAFT_1135234 [Mycena rosella]|uniref:Uncharacterized protein n=1 Tax=Mycena rosella TaxID=1033263 RepID=A0AAD7DE60_MYCRO|nr:hypothetical protein B0H17DRAFT_1135234 [Mycena rosella]
MGIESAGKEGGVSAGLTVLRWDAPGMVLWAIGDVDMCWERNGIVAFSSTGIIVSSRGFIGAARHPAVVSPRMLPPGAGSRQLFAESKIRLDASPTEPDPVLAPSRIISRSADQKRGSDSRLGLGSRSRFVALPRDPGQSRHVEIEFPEASPGLSGSVFSVPDFGVTHRRGMDQAQIEPPKSALLSMVHVQISSRYYEHTNPVCHSPFMAEKTPECTGGESNPGSPSMHQIPLRYEFGHTLSGTGPGERTQTRSAKGLGLHHCHMHRPGIEPRLTALANCVTRHKCIACSTTGAPSLPSVALHRRTPAHRSVTDGDDQDEFGISERKYIWERKKTERAGECTGGGSNPGSLFRLRYSVMNSALSERKYTWERKKAECAGGESTAPSRISPRCGPESWLGLVLGPRSISRFVAPPGDPGRSRRVREVEVELPESSPGLAPGLCAVPVGRSVFGAVFLTHRRCHGSG